MGYEFKHTITGAPIAGAEATPNATPPGATRVWDVPLHVRGDMGIGVFGVLEDGTSLAISGVWIRDEETGFWAELATSISLLPGIASQPAALPPGAKMFVQLGAAVGNPTKVHFGFIELANANFSPGGAAAGSVTVTSSALPTGASTAAKQDTGNTSLASLDTKLPAKGAALIAASTPVNLASDQGTTAAPLHVKPGDGTTEATYKAASTRATAADTAAVVAVRPTDPIAQPTASAAVTKSDATDLSATATKGLWVGTAGDLSVKFLNDSAATTMKNVPSGTYVPGSFARVMAATTASDIVALS